MPPPTLIFQRPTEMTATESQLETPPAGRLVIRVKLVSQEPPPPPAKPRLSKTALLAILGTLVILLGWLGFHIFGTDSAPPLASDKPVPKPAVEAVAAVPAQPEVREPSDVPLSPINQVVPDVPRSALDTIRGTIKVSVRVTIDEDGKVVDAITEERGPSRYFERLAVSASKKWTFTPAKAEDKRTMQLQFNFRRDGATAQANPDSD